MKHEYTTVNDRAEEKERAKEIKKNLAHFHGTEAYYRLHRDPEVPMRYDEDSDLPLPAMFLTDGAKYLGEQGYFWFYDAIAYYQTHPTIRNDEMLQRIQFWHLTVKDAGYAWLAEIRCDRDKDDTALSFDMGLEFPYSASVLDEVMLYVQPLHLSPFDMNKEGKRVIHLPSEY